MSYYEQIVKNGYSMGNPQFKAFRKTNELGHEYAYVNGERILGEWVYGYRSAKVIKNEDGSYTTVPTIRDIAVFGDFFHDHEYEVVPETVCMFTGLFDKDHRPLYLNDLVLASRHHMSGDGYIRKGFPTSIHFICKVKFGRNGFENLEELGVIPEHELAAKTYQYRWVGTHLWPVSKGPQYWNPETKRYDKCGDGVTCEGIERIGNIFEVENWKDAYKGNHTLDNPEE